MKVLTEFEGWVILIIYGIAMYLIAYFWAKETKTKEGFLVAHRKLGFFGSSMSIAGTWIWAPALFVAAQKAYQEGIVGLFWFLVPNVACLIVFAEFAHRFRNIFPVGYTLPEYMEMKYSKRVKGAYLFEMLGLSTCCFAVQLLGGALIIATLTGISFFTVTVVLTLTALAYSLLSGIKASVLTDHLQMWIIYGVILLIVPWVVIEAGGLDRLWAGLGGFSGKFTSLTSPAGFSVFLNFGLAVTIGLMSGPFGDQAFWQRAQSTEKSKVRSSFVLGAILFGIVPLCLSVLGFVAAGTQYKAASAQLVNLEIVVKYLPAWVTIPFVFMILSGLVSTLDSVLCAVSSIFSVDLYDGDSEKDAMAWARMGMLLVAILGTMIANIPGMQILYLFLFYGTLRASTLLPTVLTLLSKKPMSEPGMFWGIVASIVVGLPVFAYGNFNKLTFFIVAGSLITVLTSGVMAFALKRGSR